MISETEIVWDKPFPLLSGVFNFQVDKSKFSDGALFGSNCPLFSTLAAWVIVIVFDKVPPLKIILLALWV